MAWTNVGEMVTLAPGEAVTWTYSFAGLADQGVQFAHANPQASPAALGIAIASDQGMQVVGINQAEYRVTITNIDPASAVRHNLRGGGLT